MRNAYCATAWSVAALGAGLLLAACGSSGSTPAASATSASASASQSPTVAATSPASSECTSFAQVYNSQVGPVLKGNGATGDVYLTEIKDAFTALAATVSGATDPYSQTIAADAEAVAAAPSSYTALGTFNTDLATFLKVCGMNASS